MLNIVAPKIVFLPQSRADNSGKPIRLGSHQVKGKAGLGLTYIGLPF